MDFPRAVQANADQKIVRFEKFGPSLGNQRAVCLQGIGNDRIGRGLFRLQKDNLPKKIQTGKQRFPALPGKTGNSPGHRHVFPDEFL